MIEESHFKTFLYISKNKYQIFVYDKNNLKNIYNEEIRIDDEIELYNLSKFLDENIYKIEKTINNFIRSIILIIENDKVLSVDISFKKKNYEKNIYHKHLEKNLKEVKDIFRENYQNHNVMHMVIINKDINENNLLSNNDNINDDYLYLEVNFISIQDSFTFIYDKLLEKHQIRIEQYMSGGYIKSFLSENENELTKMANQINNGFNKNEVRLVSKNTKNKRFFERFFQLFS
jgi:hypothetical protein